MGRSPFFKAKKVIKEDPLPASKLLTSLKVNDLVDIEFKDLKRRVLTRGVSTYGLRTTPIDDGRYKVISINHDPDIIIKTRVRSIAVRSIARDSTKHFIDWVITTDGYVREVEGCGTLAMVGAVALVNVGKIKRSHSDFNLQPKSLLRCSSDIGVLPTSLTKLRPKKRKSV
jgi:hypothetical protein